MLSLKLNVKIQLCWGIKWQKTLANAASNNQPLSQKVTLLTGGMHSLNSQVGVIFSPSTP